MSRYQYIKWTHALLLLAAAGGMHPAPAGDDIEEWLDSQEEFNPDAVNEGELEFIGVPPSEPVHTHQNRITATPQSLRDGWAALYQCHAHLDPVPAAEIVFNEGRIRKLRVERATGIGRARAAGVSVQLEDVSPGAELCISGETRVIVPQPGGGFLVRNGPFMRRFLDGFYPMHVILDIVLPEGAWMLAHASPAAQPGFEITRTAAGVRADAWFSGELRTEFHFLPADNVRDRNLEKKEQP